MLLTPEQQEAFERLCTHVALPSNQAGPKIFTLTGSAGTGKSTLLNHFIANATSQIKKIKETFSAATPIWEAKMVAPTHKALSQFRVASTTGFPVETGTFHSHFGGRVIWGGGTKWTKVGASAQLLIVDEASMLDQEMCDLLLQANSKSIILVGDPYQLLAVKGKDFNAFEYISQNANCEQYHLTKVVRQAEGNPIIQLAQSYREKIENALPYTHPEGSDTVHYLSEEDFSDKLLTDLRQGKASKLLSYTNKGVASVTANIRNELGLPDHLTPYEPIVGKAGSKNGLERFAPSGLVHKVATIKIPANLLEMQGADETPATLQLEGYATSTHFFIEHETWKAFEKAYGKLVKKSARHMQLMSDMVASAVAKPFPFAYGYAGTVHTSQGSSYDNVYILQGTFPTHPSQADTANRLMYVACTRSKNQIYLPK